MEVTVRKYTDEALMRRACEMTFNGKSHQSLLSIYKSEHSPDTLPDHHLGESFIDLCDLCLNFSHCLDGQNVSHIAEPQLRHVYQRLCVDAQAEFDTP